MYDLIGKIKDSEIRNIMGRFYTDLCISKIYIDDIDFRNTPIKGYNYDIAIEDFKKLVKFIIKNQKK